MGGCVSVEVKVVKGENLKDAKESGSMGKKQSKVSSEEIGSYSKNRTEKGRKASPQTALPGSHAESSPSASTGALSVTDDGIVKRRQVKKYRLVDLQQATKDFSEQGLLGEGSFGKVYRGTLVDKVNGELEVAVKVMKESNVYGFDELLAEVLMLDRFHHPHLVQLYGYCTVQPNSILVYELCPHGSLEEALFSDKKGQRPFSFSWDQRVKAMRETAQALAFLHENNVIHRDLKPSNILLSQDLEVRVTDFGMAKQAEPGKTHVSTKVMGTLGYLDPTYMATGYLRDKSDVYSFGIILLQVLTGRPAMLAEDVTLAGSMARQLQNPTPDIASFMDPRLEGQYSNQGALRMTVLAKHCVSRRVDERPNMKDVLKHLEAIQTMKC